ncbi:pentatricopeptide repeat-containing protein 1, mitochondrial [Palaemon carinicauda]|uniref:pentatricopeptide repeat-containing protein 1, mitochondrial n=1 Tax=Palaemon carinicauda TaxID=392227 RepID=UPI0035B5786C
MYVVKGNIRWCKSLKHAACALSNTSLHREVSLSSRCADSIENEEPSFGLLSSDPNSKFYEENKINDVSPKKSPPDHKEQKLFKQTKVRSDSISALEFNRRTRFPKYASRNAWLNNSLVPESKENTLTTASNPIEDVELKDPIKIWQSFKSAENEKVQRLSQNLVEDDDEEELHHYLSSNSGARLRTFNEKFDRKKRLGRGKQNTGTELLTQDSTDEPFGTLSPPKDLYEDESGDEGDERQRKYEEAQLERRHSPVYYGNRMKKLCNERKLADALKILEEEMPAANAKPDVYCYQVLINACGRAGYTKKAFKLYNQMKKRGIKPQPVTYTGLFNACANSPWPATDGLLRAQKLRKQLQDKEYPVNQTISHAMIKAFGRCGEIKTAFTIVDEMLDQGLIVNIETISFMLQACISDQETGFRHALMVWRKMRELRIDPGIYTYNLLVRCINDCKAGHPELTSQLLEGTFYPEHTSKAMKKKESRRDSKKVEVSNFSKESSGESESMTGASEEDLGSSQITASQVEVISKNEYLKGTEAYSSSNSVATLPNLLGRKLTVGSVIGLSSLDKAEDRLALVGGPAGLFAQMLKDKVVPDLKTVTQLLDSLPSNSEVEESFLESMKNIGLTPDTQFFNMLIRKRCYRGDNVGAKDVLVLIQEQGLLPDLITFGCLALSCKTLDSATEFLQSMDAAGFRPNIEIMNILVKNSVVKDNYYYTYELLREMHHRGVQPDENLMLWLEKARNNAREMMIKLETGKREPSEDEKKKLDYIKIFLYEYKNWLRKSDMQLDDHPWAQYNYAKAKA